MTLLIGKFGKVALSATQLKKLAHQVFELDKQECCQCRRRSPLEAHHLIPRSTLRLDLPWNLCTLCHYCHERVTRHEIYLIRPNLDSRQVQVVDRETYRMWVREQLVKKQVIQEGI